MSNRPHVVVVEDEPLIREMIEVALENEGYELTVLETAGAALALFEVDGTNVRCLVTNIDLGSSVDGFALAGIARAKNPQLPVIYMTGAAQHRFPVEKVPNSELVAKPFALEELAAAVRRNVDLPGPTERALLKC